MIDNKWLTIAAQEHLQAPRYNRSRRFLPIKCPECNFNTKEKSVFQDHTIEKHPLSFVFFGKIKSLYLSSLLFVKETNKELNSNEDKKTFKCTICDYSCSHNHNLAKHIGAVHEGKKPFKCSICDYSCSQKGHLTHHIASIHEGKKPFTCTVCYYKFSLKHHLASHIVQGLS